MVIQAADDDFARTGACLSRSGLGFSDKIIHAAYVRAKSAGIYDSVRRNNGKTERAYALTDDHEYFAEASEAFFGTNDFYPFVRQELKAHDPELFQILEAVWK